jgi:dihydrofolate reductase
MFVKNLKQHMRKLKLQVQMTLDGFIAGPNGEMDWMTWNWDEELKSYVTELTAPVDCIVLGRKLAEGFIPHWSSVAADQNNPEFEAGEKFTDTAKVVFTKTLPASPWGNTLLAKGELAREITSLKNENGGDLIAYGGASFVASLIKEKLIDEFHLFINPVAIGRGMAIFGELDCKQNLTLVKATPFACGIVVHHYRLENGQEPPLETE